MCQRRHGSRCFWAAPLSMCRPQEVKITGSTPNIGMQHTPILGGGMKTFRQFLAALREEDEDPGLGDLGTDSAEDILKRVADHIIRSHKEDFVSLVESLATNDDKLKEDLRSYRMAAKTGGKAALRRHMPNKQSSKPDKDVICPSSADTGYASG